MRERTLVHTWPRDWADMSTYPAHPRGRWTVRVDFDPAKFSVGVDVKHFPLYKIREPEQEVYRAGRGWYLVRVRLLPCVEIVIHTPRFGLELP